MKNYDLETICVTVVNVPCWSQNFQHLLWKGITFSMCSQGNEFQFVMQALPPFGPIYFIFTQFLAKILSNNRFAHQT